MKVAFWGDFHSAEVVTGSIAAIISIVAIHYGRTVVVNRDHICNHNLQDCFFQKELCREGEDPVYCYYYGEIEYFRFLWEKYGSGPWLPVERRLMENVYLLYPPDLLEPSLFRETAVPNTSLKDALFFLNIAGGKHNASKQALEEADLVVIFLPQNMSVIKTFLDKYSSIIPKALFLISDYERTRSRETGCSPARFVKRFHVDSRNISIIPRNQEFKAAFEEGRMESFIRANLSCSIKNKNYSFMQHLFVATEMILERERGMS